jgi:hypothetical protein
MARHKNNGGIERLDRLEREIKETKRLAARGIELLESLFSALELSGGITIQIDEGESMDTKRKLGRTDNIIVAGTIGTFRAIPIGGIFPPGASLNWVSDNPRVTNVPSADGIGTDQDFSVPANEPAGTFNITWSVTRTDNTVITSAPLLVTIQAAGTGSGELTGGQTQQVA